jgi:plastocyanin
MRHLTLVAGLGAVLLACEPTTQQSPDPSLGPGPALSAAAAAATATVQFGLNQHGSPFPPQVGHDHSSQAKDVLVPRTVVISQGGSVSYTVDEVHQVAVYQAGTEPEAITVDGSTLESVDLGFGIVLPQFRINDPNGRLALSPPQALVDQTWTTPPGTFDEPGRYLVICTSVPHFVLNTMYGWVIVK